MIAEVIVKIKDIDSIARKIRNSDLDLKFDKDESVMRKMDEIFNKDGNTFKKLGQATSTVMSLLTGLVSSKLVKVDKHACVKFLISNWVDACIREYIEKCVRAGTIEDGSCNILEYDGDYFDGEESVTRKVELNDNFRMKVFDGNDERTLEEWKEEDERSGKIASALSAIGRGVIKTFGSGLNKISESLSGSKRAVSIFLNLIDFDFYLNESKLTDSEVEIKIKVT